MIQVTIQISDAELKSTKDLDQLINEKFKIAKALATKEVRAWSTLNPSRNDDTT